MSELKMRAREESRYDAVALGEVMLRLDPGEGRIRAAREFRVWEGGGEYNMVRGLSRCFGMRTAIVTALADNEVGRLVESLILQGGVDTSFLRWFPYDGVGRSVRNGLNFTERGFGIRGAVGTSDRGHTAASVLRPEEVDWNHLFGTLGVRWFHTGGIYAGLSENTPDVIERAMTAAHQHGTVVSYDLNYRHSLWEAIGGQPRAQQINRHLALLADVLLGNEEDFTAALGLEVGDLDDGIDAWKVESFQKMMTEAVAQFPNLTVVATSLRTVHSATVNDWSAIAWSREDGFVQAPRRVGLEVLDRVGGGDAFASGLIYGLLEQRTLAAAVAYGAAHGALAMTTPGDTSMASLDEVERLVRGGGARARR
jgi:2-dehydro-3-deoxygluconokinase